MNDADTMKNNTVTATEETALDFLSQACSYCFLA